MIRKTTPVMFIIVKIRFMLNINVGMVKQQTLGNAMPLYVVCRRSFNDHFFFKTNILWPGSVVSWVN